MAKVNARWITKAADKSTFKSLGHAGAAIRLTARRSIKRSAKASSPGSPAHTRKGQIKRAIRFKVEKGKQRVVIGPAHEVVGPAAKAHEHGGKFRGQRYPKRPFMGPALIKMKDRLPKLWADSVR